MVTTMDTAAGPQDVHHEWIIVAIRPTGRGIWEPTMSFEDWRVFKAMVDDCSITTTQRRDTAGTVLLAKMRKID